MAGSTGGAFPDLPQIPRLPHLRRHASAKAVVAAAELVVRAAGMPSMRSSTVHVSASSWRKFGRRSLISVE